MPVYEPIGEAQLQYIALYRQARAELAKETASLKTVTNTISSTITSKISTTTAKGSQKTVEDFEADTETIKKLTSWFTVASMYLNKSISPAEK